MGPRAADSVAAWAHVAQANCVWLPPLLLLWTRVAAASWMRMLASGHHRQGATMIGRARQIIHTRRARRRGIAAEPRGRAAALASSWRPTWFARGTQNHHHCHLGPPSTVVAMVITHCSWDENDLICTNYTAAQVDQIRVTTALTFYVIIPVVTFLPLCCLRCRRLLWMATGTRGCSP